MSKFLLRYATPATTGLFLVSLISGVFLYLHIGTAYFHEMHEVLSMVLIIPFVVHLWRNWRPFLNYFKRAPMMIALVLSLAASLYFVYPKLVGTEVARGGRPEFGLARQMMKASVADVAPAMGTTPKALVEKLKGLGFAIETVDMSLREIAAVSGKNEMELMAALVPARSK